MKRTLMAASIVIVGILGLTACGGGGDGSSPAPGPGVGDLQGSWLGAYQIITTPYTLGVELTDAGNITEVRRDGALLFGLTGSVAKEHGNIFGFTLSDGTSGGFFADNRTQHIAFLDEDGNFGVLQKNAGSLPTYFSNDLAGRWSGYTVALDANMNITREGTSNAIVENVVNGTSAFTGKDIYGDFGGSFSAFSNSRGFYVGSWSSPGVPTGGMVVAWLSADKTFIAAWACTGTNTYVAFIPNCSFSAWQKQ